MILNSCHKGIFIYPNDTNILVKKVDPSIQITSNVAAYNGLVE